MFQSALQDGQDAELTLTDEHEMDFTIDPRHLAAGQQYAQYAHLSNMGHFYPTEMFPDTMALPATAAHTIQQASNVSPKELEKYITSRDSTPWTGSTTRQPGVWHQPQATHLPHHHMNRAFVPNVVGPDTLSLHPRSATHLGSDIAPSYIMSQTGDSGFYSGEPTPSFHTASSFNGEGSYVGPAPCSPHDVDDTQTRIAVEAPSQRVVPMVEVYPPERPLESDDLDQRSHNTVTQAPAAAKRSRTLVKPQTQIDPQTRIECKLCDTVSPSKSAAKKHLQRHEKVHKCDVLGCDRAIEGFPTINDLDRHLKTVHGRAPSVGSTAYFVCSVCQREGNKNTNKFWRRKDNFKAHVERKHAQGVKDKEKLARIVEPIVLDSTRHAIPDDGVTAVLTAYSAGLSQADELDARSLDHGKRDSAEPPELPEGPAAKEMLLQDMYMLPPGHEGLSSMVMPSIPRTVSLPSQLYPAPSLTGPSGRPIKRPRTISESLGSAGAFKQRQQSLLTVPAFPSSSSDRTNTATSTLNTSFSSESSTETVTTVVAMEKCSWGNCEKEFRKNRQCDIKKHRKRHEKAYGCTMPHCSRRFGSRDDWKRHETTQHYLHEMWKCGERGLNSSNNKEGQVTICDHPAFMDPNKLRGHLYHDHHIHVHDQLTRLVKEYRLGNEGNDQYWCGFCAHSIVVESKDALDAWTARLDHIGRHFDTDGKHIRDWICVKHHKPKKDLDPEEMEILKPNVDVAAQPATPTTTDPSAVGASTATPLQTTFQQPSLPGPYAFEPMTFEFDFAVNDAEGNEIHLDEFDPALLNFGDFQMPTTAEEMDGFVTAPSSFIGSQ